MSFLSSEPVGKHFPEPKTRGLKRKQPFRLTKLEYLQSQTCQNTTLGHFFILYDSKFQQVFVFSGRIMVLAVSCGESSDSTVLKLIRVKQIKKSIYMDSMLCPKNELPQL